MIDKIFLTLCLLLIGFTAVWAVTMFDYRKAHRIAGYCAVATFYSLIGVLIVSIWSA